MSGNRLLCMCGCGDPAPLARKTDARIGNVKGMPCRYIVGHQARRAPAPVAGYLVNEATGCWEWLLKVDRAGYGRTKRNGKSVFAHRLMWEDTKGPVPPGMELDHLCVNPRCINPEHLEIVTPTENKRRSRATKLTHEQVASIKSSPASNASLATAYGVDPSNISHIRRGFSWKDVQGA